MHSAQSSLSRRHVGEFLGELGESFRENLADWEISASDAGKLMKAFTQVSDVVRAEGLAGLSAHLQKRCTELKDARRSADRGTHDNIPWWKFLIIAGIFGWMIAGSLIALFLSGSDPKAAGIMIGITEGMVIGGWVALMLFC